MLLAAAEYMSGNLPMYSLDGNEVPLEVKSICAAQG
jgi:hypothetical protein